MISLRSVTKRYGDQPPAVTSLSLEVEEGELCILLGPSGGGKTTTLKMVNRLIEPTSGEIFVNGQSVLNVDPVELRRGIGYVMQQGGLFPHERVRDNVATVPRLLHWPKDKIRARVRELLELVGLDPDRYERRYPHELSGGERQRVGVARALGGDPPVLLMDEPFGAVDPIVRKRLQEEFAELQQRLGKTVLFVTHDIEEAVVLGTRIAVLSPGGLLEQYGTPTEVIGRPATKFVSDFVGADQGLHRLEVTKVKLADLTGAPHLHLKDSLAEANDLLHRAGYRFGLVVGDNEELVGWVARDNDSEIPAQESAKTNDGGSASTQIEMRGTENVGALLRPFESSVPLGSSLQKALASMLDHDDGFVAISDGDRIVGVLTPDDLYAAMRHSLYSQPAPSPRSAC
jgi:osmoprotectant transport system ATP-binding protein